MEKLEMKQIQNYLSAGVQFISSMDVPFDEHFKNPKWTLDGTNKLFGDYCLLTKENNDAYAIHTCKLILHPLSRLTEPILDGNTPIDWLQDEYFTLTLHEQCKRILEDERWINHCDWLLIQHLFEWHFDVFGLIEKGLAIEKQPLKQ